MVTGNENVGWREGGSDEGVPVVLLFSFLLRKCDHPIH